MIAIPVIITKREVQYNYNQLLVALRATVLYTHMIMILFFCRGYISIAGKLNEWEMIDHDCC